MQTHLIQKIKLQWPNGVSEPLNKNSCGRTCHRITESQNVWAWKGPLWVI